MFSSFKEAALKNPEKKCELVCPISQKNPWTGERISRKNPRILSEKKFRENTKTSAAAITNTLFLKEKNLIGLCIVYQKQKIHACACIPCLRKECSGGQKANCFAFCGQFLYERCL